MLDVVLNIYSGRPNPQWTLTDTQEASFLAQLKQITKTTLTKPSGVLPRLGYRGFFVSRSPRSPLGPLSLWIQDQVVDFGQNAPNKIADNRELERWLLDTGTGTQISKQTRSRMTNILAQPPLDAAALLSVSEGGNCQVCQAQDAPAYNPGLWNQLNVQPYNNCYNYANDQITNTFAQPGLAHNIFPANRDCFDYQQAAAADGLVPCNGFADALAEDEGWYVALVMDPGEDFHWYRQDDNGCWSHKPGEDQATNLDNSGNPITDPAICDRGDYTDFCSYMITTRNVVIRLTARL